MATIEERRRLVEAKLKEMGEDGVMKEGSKVTQAFDPPEEDDREAPMPIAPPAVETKALPEEQDITAQLPIAPNSEEMDIARYAECYFQPVRLRERTAFTMRGETLQLLRNVLQDLGERIPMASYIDNIIRQHLRQHQEMLNKAAAKQRRKTTLSL